MSKTSKEEVKEGDKAQFLSYVRESSNVKDNGGSQNAKSSKAEGITLKEKEEKSSVETKDGSKVLDPRTHPQAKPCFSRGLVPGFRCLVPGFGALLQDFGE